MDIIQRIGERERKYVEEVLSMEFRTSAHSVMTRRLEEAFAKKFDSKYAVAFCNGTATLHIALEAVGVGMGDEVIVPPLTMSSTTFGVLHANATPVFADVDPDTFQISAESIEKCITPRTKAIVVVSLFGLAPDFDAINAIAKKHGLAVIEDDAQCFLGKYKGKTVGTLGDIASFSFQSSKHITSGEGGMLITQSEELADKIRKYSCLGYAGVSTTQGKIAKTDIQNPDYSRHVSLGWNYRLSDVCSAVALGQLEHIDELVEMRKKSAAILADAIKGIQIDLAILNFPWITLAKGRNFLTQVMKPKKVLVCHLPYVQDDENGFRQSAQRNAKLLDFADVYLLQEELQTEVINI